MRRHAMVVLRGGQLVVRRADEHRHHAVLLERVLLDHRLDA